MSIGLAIIIGFLALAGNAFFVGAEFGLVSARRSSIENLANKGSKYAKKTLFAMENVSIMLTTAQFAITLFSLILGAVSEPLIANLLAKPLGNLGLNSTGVHIISIGMALSIMTYIHVVIGEMIPKYLAIARPEKTAIMLVPGLVFVFQLLKPIVFVLNSFANVFLKMIKVTPKDEITSVYTRDEVAGFIYESANEGLIDDEEVELLKGALLLDEVALEKILITLDSVIAINPKSTVKDIQLLVNKYGFSRYPVIYNNECTGYVHIKDCIDIDESNLNEPLNNKYIRPLSKISTNESLRSVLSKMQNERCHLGLVYNKNKAIGVIALEDVLEILVGTIHDQTHRKF